MHEGLQCQIQACIGADQLGSANAATGADKPYTSKPTRSATGFNTDLLNKLDDYMENMANSVNN